MTWNRDDGLCMNTQKEHRLSLNTVDMVKCDQYTYGTQDVVHEWQYEGVRQEEDRVLVEQRSQLAGTRDAGANFQQEAKVFVEKGCPCEVQVQSERAVPPGTED